MMNDTANENRMKIIDFHVHLYWNEQQYANKYCLLRKDGIASAADKIRKDMVRAGIGHVCGSVIERGGTPWRGSFDQLRGLNRAALELREKLSGFYTPGFHIHPLFVRESIEEITYMARAGVGLIGELVPYAHGAYLYSDKGMKEILDAAESYHMTVSFHSSDHDDAEHMIKGHPNLSFVAAHPGERNRMERHLNQMKKYTNLCLDLSGTGLARLGMLEYGVHSVGAERFLFGTDYPINNPAMYVQGVLYENVSEQEKEMIFYRNAEKIIGSV